MLLCAAARALRQQAKGYLEGVLVLIGGFPTGSSQPKKKQASYYPGMSEIEDHAKRIKILSGSS